MLLEVILILVLLLIIYLLWMPVEIGIDTYTNKYYLQLKGLAEASVEGHEAEILRIKFKVFFFKFYFYPLKRKAKDKTRQIESGKKKKIWKRYKMRKMVRVVRSFKVKKFLLDLDTGDYTLNAKLYPVFTGLNFTRGNFAINFEGRNRLALLIRNRPINIIKSFINF